jgi:hypothetical protein
MRRETNVVGGTLFKKVDYSLAKLLHDIEFGDIGLPDIQRPFVWSSARVRDLFDSMYKGFPVGYLLFWANDELVGTKQIGTDGKQHRVPRLLIVDGQQRLTSLYAVLRGKEVFNSDYRAQRIQIAFRPRDGRFEVADAAIKRDPEFIADLSSLFSGGTSFSVINSFLEKLGQSRHVEAEERELVAENIDRVFDLQNYPFTAMEVSSVVDEEQVADIFVRINSEGVKLNQADFILTLLSVFWDEGRAELEAFSRASRQPSLAQASPYNHHIQPDPDQLLRVAVAVGFKRGRLKSVYQVLRGKDPETELFSPELRDQQFDRLRVAQGQVLNLTSWHEFLKSLMAAGYRSGQIISSENSLLYSYAFYLIGKHEYGLEPFRLRRLMARWFFMASLTGRYTSSPETIMDQDLARLRAVSDGQVFESTLDKIVTDTLTADFWNIGLPNELATSSARSPSMFAYYAALNVLGAPILFSKAKVAELFDPAIHGTRAPLERHHLFPVAYLKASGIEETREINQIANFTLVEWGENGEITDRAPADYYPEYARRFTELELARMHHYHALAPGWQHMTYEAFLADRRIRLAGVIREAYDVLAGQQTAAATIELPAQAG